MLSSASASRLLLITVSVLVALFGPCGCARRSVSNTPGFEANYHDVVDDTGRTVRLPIRPKRIVSLAPSLTEIVFVVGAGSKLVGDTSYCDYPEEAKRVTHIGDTLNPNIELIIGLKPDLVLISTASQLEAFSKQLDQQKIPAYISDPHDLNGVLTSIVKIGDLLDEGDNAKKVANSLNERARNVESRVKGFKPVRVFYQVSAEPLYTAGRDSFVTDLIKRAGGESVTAAVPGAWPRFSNESALAANPDAIIIPTGDSMAGGSAVTVSDALKNSAAVRNRRVYFINGDLLSRPGPRLVEGLEEMAKDLHP